MSTLNIFPILMAPKGGEGNPMSMLIFMGLIILIFYFFMMRPQIKKRKELQKFRNEMKQGDKVMTIGGIYGKINAVKENSIIIEVESGHLLKVDKNAIIKDSSGMMIQR